MEIKQTTDIPELLRELGIKYDPDRLAEVLKSRRGQVRSRAVQVTATVGAFVARILKVRAVHSAHLAADTLGAPNELPACACALLDLPQEHSCLSWCLCRLDTSQLTASDTPKWYPEQNSPSDNIVSFAAA